MEGSSPELDCKPEPVQVLIFSKHLTKLDLTGPDDFVLSSRTAGLCMNLVSVGGLRHAKRIDLTLQSWRAQVLWHSMAKACKATSRRRLEPRSPVALEPNFCAARFPPCSPALVASML